MPHEPPIKHERPYMTVPEAGRHYFGAGRNKAYELAEAGLLVTVQIGRKIIVPVAAQEIRMTEFTKSA